MDTFARLDAFDWRRVGAKRDIGASGDEEGMPYLRFSIEAYDLFGDWRAGLEKRVRRGDMLPAMESHLAKYRKLVPGIALILHLVEGAPGPVGVEAIRLALAWAKYLETHARRAYGSATATTASTSKAILTRIKDGHLSAEFSSREVWRPQWTHLTDRDAVTAGLKMLVDYDWLLVAKRESGGRPQWIYSLNPRVKL
jgi:putative DNA primase/helicase